MVLNTIVKAVKRKSHRGSQSVTSDQITTDIVACVNESLRDVCRMLPKQFFHKKAATGLAVTTGVVGTPAVYSLASDVQEPIVFWYNLNSQFYRLSKIPSDQEWMTGVWDPNGALNNPRFFREIGPDSSGYKQIEIYPIPIANLTLNYEYYRVKTSDLDTDDLNTEVPDLPDYLQDVVEKGALYYFLKGFDDPLQGVAKTDYEQAKLALEIADEQNADSLPALRFAKKHYTLPGFRLEG